MFGVRNSVWLGSSTWGLAVGDVAGVERMGMVNSLWSSSEIEGGEICF